MEDQFSNFTWNNTSTHVVGISEYPIDGKYCMTTPFGIVYFDSEDAPHILQQLEVAVNLLKDKFARSNAEIAARYLMREGRKILAIKEYRRIMHEQMGQLIGLKEAKDFVEGLKL